MARAAIDGGGSAETTLEAIAISGQWNQYTGLEAAKHLLNSDAELPARTLFDLVDSGLERTQN